MVAHLSNPDTSVAREDHGFKTSQNLVSRGKKCFLKCVWERGEWSPCRCDIRDRLCGVGFLLLHLGSWTGLRRKSLYHLDHLASSHYFFFFVVLGLESNTRSAVVLTPLVPAILQLLDIEIYLFEIGSTISLVWS